MSSKDNIFGAYYYEDLLPENVFGHTKKITLFRKVIERARYGAPTNSLRILDIGCGSGHAVTRFLGRVGDEVLGIDLFPPNIEYAESRYKKVGLNFICQDVNKLSFNGKIFDIVVLADILEHVTDVKTVLKDAAKLLAPNGRILITVPNGRGPFEIESSLSRAPYLGRLMIKFVDCIVAVLNKTIFKGAWSRAADVLPVDLPYNIDSGHVQFFSKHEIIRLISETGLQVVDMHNLSFLSGPFTNYFFTPWQSFCRWNTHVAYSLPHWAASAWFFECKKLRNG